MYVASMYVEAVKHPRCTHDFDAAPRVLQVYARTYIYIYIYIYIVVY